MESLYKQFINEVLKGRPFKIDLKTKTLKVNKTIFVDKGVVKEDRVLISDTDLNHIGIDNLFKEPYAIIESLYKVYKRSIPTKSSDGNRGYFKAVKADELTDNELVINFQRSEAQAMLEGYILFANLQGFLQWSSENHWFWQGEDRDLVILKDWI